MISAGAKEDIFLSKQLKRRCGTLVVVPGELQLVGNYLNSDHGFDFITIKGTDLEGLTGSQLQVVPGTVDFSGIVKVSHESMNHSWTVKSAEPKLKEQVLEIARASFESSRFHQDDRIDSQSAQELKASWASNFFDGTRGDDMLVATSQEGNVAGFCLLLTDGDKLVVDLIAVSADCRGRGVGTKLLSGLNGREISAGTQTINTAAARLYRSVGLVERSHTDVRHWHRQ